MSPYLREAARLEWERNDKRLLAAIRIKRRITYAELVTATALGMDAIRDHVNGFEARGAARRERRYGRVTVVPIDNPQENQHAQR